MVLKSSRSLNRVVLKSSFGCTFCVCYFDLTKKNLYSILIIYRLEQNRGPSSPQAGPSGLQSNQNRSLNAHDLQLDCLSSDTEEEEEVTVVKICRRRKDQAVRELNGTVIDGQKLKEAQTCKICLVKEIRVVFLPCGHLMSCVNCTRKLKKCAVCTQFIHKKQKTYRS